MIKQNGREAAKQPGAEERIAYANTLNIGVKTGLATLVISFLIYISGALAPIIPFTELSVRWTLPVHEFIEKTGSPSGWGWVWRLNRGDALNFFAVAWLSSVTLVCYLRIIPILARKKDTIYLVIALLEVVVLFLAASGWLRVGGH
ncbi:MAG: hypothetical protein HQK86_10040 [Nitrospinae bacterium]|nr:hypothetical protein [Nitrospinota bacterium]MBF0633489.1 hypothetical protein [Nitrospinota bacterium]